MPLYEYHFVLACNRTYDGAYGRILNDRYPTYSKPETYCEFGIHLPDPSATVSIYFDYFMIREQRWAANCTDSAYLKVTIPILTKYKIDKRLDKASKNY